jgi:ribosome biogenesis GTPase
VHTSPPVPLPALGWDDGWAAAFAEQGLRYGARGGAGLRPGRVARVDRSRCVVLTSQGPVHATLGAPVLERMAGDSTAVPCAGDWCGVRVWPDGPVTVDLVVPRRTAVVRADVAGSSRAQVLAANVDVLAVVVALVPEPVLGRVERLLALAWESGARPVVVLTKNDLVGDGQDLADDIASAAPGVDVLLCSAVTGEGMDAVAALPDPGTTVGLLGSSGAGKSTLVNALAGAEVLRTREIRTDGRGRHTTVARELVPLPGGGLLIDTPGMRGLGLPVADAGLAATFADVEEAASRCRFRDCSHTGEPGCAVMAAVEDGEIPVRRLESWRKLQREAEWMAARSDARLRAERARVWRQRTKEHRRRTRG